MSKRIEWHIADGVAHAQLARPEKINAVDMAMFEALVAVPAQLRAEPQLRCVVLSGHGRGFCAGLDTGAFAQMASDPDTVARLLSRYPGSEANRAQQAVYGWAQLPVPVIAAVHGVCFGAGLQLALAADLRIVSAGAQLSVMEIKWGLVPDMTGVQALQRLVRADVAKELTYTGRRVGGEEAVALGLATRVAEDPVAAALALAQDIAQRSPDAIRAAKKLLDQSARLPFPQALALEAALQRQLIGGANQMEAVMSNMQKRAPRFIDPPKPR